MRVSLAWFRDPEGARRQGRYTDRGLTQGNRDGANERGKRESEAFSSAPPPLPPKPDRPPRSPVSRPSNQRERLPSATRSPIEMGRSPSIQRQPSPRSPRRYDTSPSQHPNATLHRSNTYMTNLPPYQPTAPITAYRVQFPHNLPVPGHYHHQRQQQDQIPPYGNPTWAMHSMPQLHVPPGALESPVGTRFGPPATAPTPFPGTLAPRTAYPAPPSPRRPPSIEPPSEASPPGLLRRLPSTRMHPMADPMDGTMTATGAPNGYGGIGCTNRMTNAGGVDGIGFGMGTGPMGNGRIPLVTPMLVRQAAHRSGRMSPDRPDVDTGRRYDPARPSMWQRMFGFAPRSRFPGPEHPTEGRIKRWRSQIPPGELPVPPTRTPGTVYARDERDYQGSRWPHGAGKRGGDVSGTGGGAGLGMSMLTRLLGNKNARNGQDRTLNRRPMGDLDVPPVSYYPQPSAQPHSQNPAAHPEAYTPAPKTKFGNLGLTGRQRRFKTYQPTQVDKLEMQRRQRDDARRRERQVMKEERRNVKRAQREQREARQAEARAKRIAAATSGQMGVLNGRQGRVRLVAKVHRGVEGEGRGNRNDSREGVLHR